MMLLTLHAHHLPYGNCKLIKIWAVFSFDGQINSEGVGPRHLVMKKESSSCNRSMITALPSRAGPNNRSSFEIALKSSGANSSAEEGALSGYATMRRP
jgi:hypothetical protein